MNRPSWLQALRPEAGEITAHTALRGLAALMVILYHCALVRPQASLGPVDTLIRQGYLFVDVFFLLSGFILMRRYGASLARPSADGLRTFWLRRFLRIYPPYFVWLALAIVVWFLNAGVTGAPAVGLETHLRSIALHLAMAQSIVGAEVQYNVPLWSIAVEMIAYTVLPLLAMLAMHTGRLWKWVLVLLLAGVWWFIRQHGTLDIIDGMGSVVRCLLGFSMGALGSRLVAQPSALLRRLSRPLSLLCLAATLCAFSTNWFHVGYVAALGLVLSSSIPTPSGHTWTQGWLPMLLGRMSFSLYLAHVPVLSVVILVAAKLEAMTGMPFFSSYPAFAATVVAATLLVAIPSWRWVEVSLTHWLNHTLIRRAINSCA